MSTSKAFVGRYSAYPDLTGQRQAEGGKRLQGELAEGREGAPLVTIITVCWNSAKTIERTFRSVRDQTYSNIEYVVVDGGSSDGTVDLLKAHEDLIDYYVSEPDDGLYYAMNKGLELAQGDYILILNSDDWYAPHCVETLVNAHKSKNVDFVSGLANYVDAEGELLHLQPSFPYDAGVYFRMPLRHETMLLSAAIYNAVGPYDTRYRINGDRALTIRLFAAGYSHYEIQKPLMYFRNTGVSSTQMDALQLERERMISRNFPELTPADVSTLARLDTLTPERLNKVIAHYDLPELSLAALALAKDRASKGAKAWVTFDMRNLDEEKQLQSVSIIQNKEALRIATLSTSDHGGAGIGSIRRIEALRRAGHKAELYCIFRKTRLPYVDQVKLSIPGHQKMSEPEIRNIWRDRAVINKTKAENYSAREMFSDVGSIVDFRDLRPVFDEADIVHLHWVSGMFDHDHTETLADKPVVWTLADMNAFTGGCHYSEGCEGYKDECRDCPLLGDGSDIAHVAWKKKRDAYAKIKLLHVICPSQWLADCAQESSLFGDRPVHMIPNAFPVDRFNPTNKLVARLRLGLPLDKKLIVFGADNLNNKRKGGDILAESVRHLREMGKVEGIEGVFFGSSSLDLGIKGHNMGHVSDEKKLSLIYAAADVFAFPSREDNAPLTVAEALLSGTPVVAFPVGNVPEVVQHKDTGYIARYEDAEDFAKGLVWALAAPRSQEALARGLRSHLVARTHNDPATAVARHLRLYQQILESTQQPPGA